MRIALAGRAGAGKSTLFDLMAGREAQHQSGRGAGLRIAHVSVPDERLDRLSEAFKPRKTTPARLEFQDLEQKAGPTWPALSPERREMLTKAELILLVVELFADEPSAWAAEAEKQWREMHEEFILLDLATVEKRLDKVEKLVRIGQKPAFPDEVQVLREIHTSLESGRGLMHHKLHEEAERNLRGYGFLSGAAVLPAFNVGEAHLDRAAKWIEDQQAITGSGREWLGRARIAFSAEVELQIRELPEEEQGAFLEAFGLRESAVSQVIRASYTLAGLESFFTTGDDEVRAWTIPAGATAPAAAGVIHTDLEKGFVRAEVLAYEDWNRLGSLAAARDQGVLRLEGKDYIVRDGDILNIRSGLAKSRG